MKDFQKSKVYRWEREVVAPRALNTVLFEQAQMFVDGVFMAHGLLFPPRAELMPNQATRVFAQANRTVLQIREKTPAWIILHELAHTLTMAHDGPEGDGHGPDFVGMYIKLLDRVLNIPLALTMYTLDKAGIKYNLAIQPTPDKNA